MGEPARKSPPPFANPLGFTLDLTWLGHSLQSRSRSELSNVAADDVAESAAIFCNAFRRMFRETLKRCQ